MSTATATAARSDHGPSHSVNHGHGHGHGPSHHSSHGHGHTTTINNTISSSGSDPTPSNSYSNSNSNSNMNIATHNNALTPKTMSSMPLAISHEVATRMLEASRSLNASLHRHKREDKSNSSGNGNGDSNSTSTNGNLLAVASQCDNALLQAHLTQMKREDLTKEETEMCLLLFLDLDKSRKLLRAFQIVECKDEGGQQSGQGQKKSSTTSSSSGSVDPILDRERILQMFKCLLMSIKTCIHYDNIESSHSDGNADGSSGPNKAIKLDPNNSPRKNNHDNNVSSEWRLADQINSDVQEIANFATGQVVEFVLQKKKKSGSADESSISSNNQSLQVPFHVFGEWYNAGGFSLVPWLELLDLAKWDYMGRAAATAAAAQAAKEKHQQQAVSMRSSVVGVGNMNMAQDHNHHDRGRSNSHGHGQRGMKPIVEEGFAVADVFNSPQYKNAAGARQSSQAAHPASQPYNSTTNNSHQPAATASSSSVSGSTSASASSSLPPLFEISFSRSGKHTIPIMEENLRMFQELVQRTGLSRRTPDQVSHVLLRNAKPSPNKNNSDPQQGQGPPIMVLNRHDFGKCVRDLVPNSSSFSREDMDRFSKFFTIFFLSFMRENDNAALGPDCVNAKELAVGFSFLCTGNKSSKLSATFGILDEGKSGYLTQHNLMRYLHSYLRMLVGISLLTASPRVTVQTLNALLSKESPRISSLCAATDNGSHWILSNFMQKRAPDRKSSLINFEEFAAWYTQGGFTIAPWLEFIDHKKFISLMNESQNPHPQHTHRQPPQSQPQQKSQSQPQNKLKDLTPAPPMNPPTSSGKIRSFDEFVAGSPCPTMGNLSQTRPKPPISHGMQEPNPKDVLFTFPLANQRKLIVLREDAAYVRLIVDQLGLLPTSPSGVWTKFLNFVKKNPLDPLPYALTKRHRSGHGLAADSDQNNFVVGVLKSIPAKCKRKRSTPPLPPTPQETLKNFFQSFDLGQVDRVAANQLMGGLTLLCGGNKSEKLSFAFGLFDMRVDDKAKKKKKGIDTTKSLCGKELFYFLRSFLIVMFSCCKQSMELRADSVSRYISDTANMVTDDAMKYQWRARKIDRINFDEFGDWYNEGGFEVAPWLELLDLNKWVLLDKAKAEKMMKEAKPMKPTSKNQLRDVSNVQVPHINEDSKHPVKEEQQQQESQQQRQQMSLQDDNVFESCPPSPPNDGDFDANADFFDNIGDGIGDLDFVDNMDAFGIDMDDMETLDIELPTMLSGGAAEAIPRQFSQESKSFQFRLMTNGKNNYSIVISQMRVNLLSTIVRECQIADISIVTMCEKMEEAKQGSSLNKERFNESIANIFIENQATSASKESKRMFFSLLSSIFSAFDTKKSDRVEASELMCGLTVLCGGRKSDKLEYTFELLDKNKKGLLSRFQMARYLHSFLTVLLTISSCKLGNEPEEEILFAANGEKVDSSISLPRVIGWVASWATEEVFKATPKSKKELVDGTECINFDNFADWYTSGGHSSITWLELLDLKKWILSN